MYVNTCMQTCLWHTAYGKSIYGILSKLGKDGGTRLAGTFQGFDASLNRVPFAYGDWALADGRDKFFCRRFVDMDVQDDLS